MSIYLSRIKLKNFRCFSQYDVAIENPLVVIEGPNGAGKTSLLEALYYSCYLRSFRSSSPKELIQAGHDNFFVQVDVRDDHAAVHAIQIGFSHNRRLVKIDEKPIASYKELVHSYRVISVTEDDLEIIKGAPQTRRLFLDQAILLQQPDYGLELRTYRHIIDQRNALLLHKSSSASSRETYEILTKQVWEKSRAIEHARREMLDGLSNSVDELIKTHFNDTVTVSFSYRPRRQLHESFDEFMEIYPGLYDQESKFGRTLFGAHLDEVGISFGGTQARTYASRGQQKLILMLLKIAQAQVLSRMGMAGVILLDDFMTDLDLSRFQTLMRALIGSGHQLILTSPMEGGFMSDQIKSHEAQVIKLTY